MLDRLRLLEKNLTALESLRRELTLDQLSTDIQKEWALRYGLLESIQIVIDVACHLVSKYNLGSPESYAECMRLLEEYDYISSDLSATLVAMAGLRNSLVHDYMVVDVKRLYGFLSNINDIRAFVQSVQRHF